MGLAVGEEVVNDHADNGEEEDDKSPDDLIGDRAVRLEDLNCDTNASVSGLPWEETITIRQITRAERLTPRDDIKNKNDKPHDTATGACLPGLR